MWNVHKHGDLKAGSPGAIEQEPKPGRTAWIWIERLLLAVGLMLLAAYGTARVESVLSSRAALEEFSDLTRVAVPDNATAGEETSSDTNSPWNTDSPSDTSSQEVDFSLWGEGRIRAYETSLTEHPGLPLGVLRISKIHLEAPIFNGTDDLTLN